MNKKLVETSLTPNEEDLKVYFMFLTWLYILHPFLILVFWNLFSENAYWVADFQCLRSRWYESHEMFRKFMELFFFSHTRPGWPASIFLFFTIMLEEGEGKVFITWEYKFLRFIRLPFHVEVSTCCPFFRVLLSFTICSNNTNLKVAKTRIFMKGNVFSICREKSFSTNQYTTNTLHVINRKLKKFNLVETCSCLPKIS